MKYLIVALCLFGLVGFNLARPQSPEDPENTGTAHKLAHLVAGNVPTDEEIEELIKDEEAIALLVDCMISLDFKEGTCDERTRKYHEVATDYLDGPDATCRTCTPEEEVQLGKLSKRIQSKWRVHYKNLLNGLQIRLDTESDY